MQTILDAFNVKEYSDGVNTSFLLTDNSRFSMTDYKVIRGQIEGRYVRCEKLMFNGAVKLLYLTEAYTRLVDLMPKFDEGGFMALVSDILHVYGDIRENGFLDCQKLLLMPEYIFVDESILKARFIYLPVDISSQDAPTGTQQLRTLLQSMVESCGCADAPGVRQLGQLLSNEMISFEAIYSEIMGHGGFAPGGSVSAGGGFTSVGAASAGGGFAPGAPVTGSNPDAHIGGNAWTTSGSGSLGNSTHGAPAHRGISLTSVDHQMPVQFCIEGRDFSIGRDAAHMDGVIAGSTLVGRKHCRVLFRNGRYYLEDNASKNGTFLNGQRLPSHSPQEILDGDYIRVANVSVVANYF